MKLFFILNLLQFFFNEACASTPFSWIDEETGHKVYQLSTIPYSSAPYFTVNVFSADGNAFFFTSPRGIHALNLKTLETELMVKTEGKNLWIIGVSRKINRIFYLSQRKNSKESELYYLDIHGDNLPNLVARVPNKFRVETVNADDTLVAGVFEDREKEDERPYTIPTSKAQRLYSKNNNSKKGIFTINLLSGEIETIYCSTEWLSHPQFSPSDPNLLMYSIEGPWHLVDRIWLFDLRRKKSKMVHHRTVEMEIAGHEFWSSDGNQIIYDWQKPKGVEFFIATYNVYTEEKTYSPLMASEWSVHFNASSDDKTLVGDGSDKSQVSRSDKGSYIRIYKRKVSERGQKKTNQRLIELDVTSLVNMEAHDYRLEPNARLTPGNKFVIFRSNMFGAPAIFGVETLKSDSTMPKISTKALSEKKKTEYRSLLISE